MGNKAWKGYISERESIIDRLFIGMIQTKIKCLKCKNKSYNFETFNTLHLQCKASTLENSFAELLSDEILKKDQ